MAGTTTNTHVNAQEHSTVMVKRLVITAIMSAMITLMTAYICHVPIGINEGYIHFGDALIYIAAAILPMPYAMAAGAIGGGIADLLTAPVWAPATIIIKMLITIPFTNKKAKIVNTRNVIALFIAFVISGIGYFVAEGIMFGFKTAFFVSIGGSVIQSSGSAIVFILFGLALDRIHFKTRFMKEV